MRSSTKLFFDVVYYFLSSLVTGPSFMSISSQVLELWQFSFISDWTEIQKSELVLSDVFPIPGDWSKLGIPNLAQMSLMKCYWMLRKKEKKNSYFFGLVKYSTLFYYWVVDWVWLDIPWFFMGVEFYNKINLVSIKSIYVILDISRKEMVSSHWNLQLLGLTVSKTSVMSAIFDFYLFEHSIL